MATRATLVPTIEANVYLVLCEFGSLGAAYIETDPSQADFESIVRNMLGGQYDRPLGSSARPV